MYDARPLSDHLEEYKEQGYTVFKSLHSEEWVEETRRMLDPEFDRHFAMRDGSPFWQGGAESGRVAMAPGFQAFEWSPFGQRLMDDIVCNSTILDFAERVMGPFVQLDSCEITGYERAGSDNTHATGWHRDGFDTSTTWNNNRSNINNGLEWRPGTSSRAQQASAKVPATRRSYTPPLACNYLTYLQATDGTANNPGLRVIPGSHRDYSSAIVDEKGRTLDSDPREVFVEAPAGSVVFTHCGILHAGSMNRLPATRFFISCYINRVGLPVRDIQQGPLVEKAVSAAHARADQRVARLLGRDDTWMEREEAMWAREIASVARL